jgi:hypothetical protein
MPSTDFTIHLSIPRGTPPSPGVVRDTKVDADANHRQNGLNLSVGVRKAGGVVVLLSISFFARRDDLHEAQPEGRKIIAQCASTGRTTVPCPAPVRGGRTVRRYLLTPRSGATQCVRLLPTAVRRGLLSFALRALRLVLFAACRYAGQVGNLRATQRVPRLPAQPAGCQPAAGFHPAPHLTA